MSSKLPVVQPGTEFVQQVDAARVVGQVIAVTQVSLNFDAIEQAVDDLSTKPGDFTTEQVAHHEAVCRAHATLCLDPSFDQQIGSYLTDAIGRLRIVQVSRKGQANTRWKRRGAG